MMNPARLLGGLALAVGGSLLLSEPLIGQDLLIELTGIQVVPLRLFCVVASIVGALALKLGGLEEKEHYRDEGEVEICSTKSD